MQTIPTLEEISQRLGNFAVFVILADTLDKWQPPTSDEGKKMLHQHYLWALGLEQQGKLILAGPVNHDIISKGMISAVGNITGLIMIKAESRQEAESIAEQDPFHISGYRKNVVHSLTIRFGAITDVFA